MKHLRILFLLLICPLAYAGDGVPKPLIVVLNAFEPELQATLKNLGLDPVKSALPRIHGVPFYRGEVDGKDVLVVETGMSMVNAALSLQLTLDRFPVTQVLFAGVAGGIDPALAVGDVVIPERWAYHGEAAYFNPDGKGGYIISDYFTPKYPNFGMIFPGNVQATTAATGKFEDTATFPADPALLAVARRALEKIGPFKSEHTGRVLKVEVGGTGVSGTVFMDNAEYRQFVFKVWHARCLDMETTAYAHVCYTNHVPFLAVRSLSDLAGGQVGKNVEEANDTPSSTNAARVLREIIREM